MDVRIFHDSLVRGFWRIVAFDGFRADPFFCDEFYRGAEEIVKESPFFGIEVVEVRHDVGIIQAVVSDPLPYVRLPPWRDSIWALSSLW